MTNEYLPARGYMRVIVLAVYIVIGAALGYVALRWLLAPALPFIAAWGCARRSRAFVAHTRIPKRVLCIILVCGFSRFGAVLAWLCVFPQTSTDLRAYRRARASRMSELR